ncbi:hypothetical protein [uncultured Brevundimonas sp.]|uniref:hypothetical protein n=1 Tax=uncultured Brevundimonas sp. TaxID=213418 RepID=UPI002636EAD0|nr:hypothetical protein [uncultured Brevundimonas sp.]
MPLSLDAFAHSSSRIAIVNKLQRLAENSTTNGRLFIELSDLPCSVSSTRVAETVAQIRGYVRRVTVRLPSNCRQVPEIGQMGRRRRDPATPRRHDRASATP